MLKGRAYRRWDDVEERLLAEAVKTFGIKSWEKIAYEMQSDRSARQLQDHWNDRMRECQMLLNELGPAPRPVPSRAPGAGPLAGNPPGRLGAESMRVPTIKYRHHPYLRDARLRARCERGDVSRVRDLMDRYLTHVRWLEEALLDPADGADGNASKGHGNGSAAPEDDGATAAACREAAEAAARSLGVWAAPEEPVGAAALVSEKDVRELLASVRHVRGAGGSSFSRVGDARAVKDEQVVQAVAAEIKRGAFSDTFWQDLSET